ncbi:MAG: DUF58 domain-containing protein [Chloroflexi bacterium]|nr:DUF58 domain-containing protein [Chloroflexota bacterium]
MDNPEARDPHAVPWLFDAYGLVGLLVATLAAASASAPQVALLAGSLLLLGVVARLWAGFCLARLAYSRRVVPRRAFCGDAVVLETSLRNRKLLPLPWVEVWELLPRALVPSGELEPSASHPGSAWLGQGASLWPYQRARWQHRLSCRHRGVYALQTARVRAGDPFGLCEREAWVRGQLEVVVYPRVVPLRRLALPLRHPSVDAASRRSLVADPTRTAGAREYRAGDPQRLIHWRATAHRGELQVRVLEPATSLQVSLALDGRSFSLPWELYRETLFELTLSALASIAVYLSQAGYPVGLFADASPPAALLPSANPAHLQALLEALARFQPVGAPQLNWWSEARLPRGSAVILAASDAATDLPSTISRLEQAGHQVLLLLAGAGAPPAAAPTHRLLRLVPGQDLAATLEGWT